MVDPFAGQNPANAQQSDSNANPSQDAFGGAPSVFADMAATAFQPIDPETGKPVPHTPDTLDPFLRDTGSDTLDTSQETLSQEDAEQLNDPFLDQSQQDDVNLHAASIDSEISSSEERQEQEEEKIPEDVVIKEPTEEPVSEQSVVEPEISEEKEESAKEVVENEEIQEQEETPKDVVIDEPTEEPVSEESSVKDEEARGDTKEDVVEEVSSPSPSTQEEIHINDPFLASVQDTVEESVSEENDKEKEEDIAPVVDPFLDDNVADQSEEPVENVHHYDPFLDDSIADEPQNTSEQNDSVEVPEDVVDDSALVEEEKTPEDVVIKEPTEEPVSEQSVVEPEISEEKEEPIEEIVEEEKITEEEMPEEENIVDSPVEQSVEDVEEASDSSGEEIVDPFLSMDMEPEVSTQDVVEESGEPQVESELPVQEDHSEKEEQPEDQIVIEEPIPEIDIENTDSALENDMSEEPVSEDAFDQNDEEGSDTSVGVSEDEAVPEDVSPEGETSENIVQGMVDGMVDPFLSTQPVDSEESEQEQAVESEEDSGDQELSPPVQKVDEDQSEETDISAIPSAELSDDEESSLEGVDEEDPSQSVEQTVQEVVEDTRAQQTSHLLAKFQELIQAVHLVHDRLDNNEDFVVIGADNDALYTTYAFHLDVSVEQSVSITKETTNRKDDDYTESHVMRFVATTESILHVYVDDVLLFTEEKLQDDVKSTMQVIDKLNKFIFLVTQFADDHSVVSGDTEKATQDFDSF